MVVPYRPCKTKDRKDKRNAGNDKGGNELHYTSFQAYIDKQAFISVSNLPKKVYLFIEPDLCRGFLPISRLN